MQDQSPTSIHSKQDQAETRIELVQINTYLQQHGRMVQLLEEQIRQLSHAVLVLEQTLQSYEKVVERVSNKLGCVLNQ